jgi:hypothetical protein
MKKVDNNANFAAGSIINHRTEHNLLSKDKNKHWVTSSMMIYKATSDMRPPCMCSLPWDCIICLKDMEVTF